MIVTGADRPTAIARSRRALRELRLEGMPSVIPFHVAVLDEPAFTAADGTFGVHTRWIETEFVNAIPAYAGVLGDAAETSERTSVVVEVNGRRVEVTLPATLGAARPGQASGNSLASPMQGTIVKVAVEEGQAVAEGDLVLVLEAMKMEQPINAHRTGTVTKLDAVPGTTVSSGTVFCEIVD